MRVLDLGAGPGVCTLLALRAGAEHVYAVDTDASVRLVSQVATENGFAGKVTALQRDVRALQPDEIGGAVDVIVSDLRGSSPLFGDHLDIVYDARKRLLRPDGVLLPCRDRLLVAPVEAPALYASTVGAYVGEPQGFRLSSLAARAADQRHTDHRHPVLGEQVLSDGLEWGTVRYGETPPDVFRLEGAALARRDGNVHGLVCWFEAELAEPGVGNGGGDLTFATAPGQLEVYGRTFLPIFPELRVRTGEALDLRLCVRRSRNDYVWSWGLADRHHISA
jgi:SAM-dependent methyltransferase